MYVFLEVIFIVLFLTNMGTLVIVGTVLFCEYDCNPPILCQQCLWKTLDDMNINFSGKLILCILTAPFTIFYTVVILGVKAGSFVIINVWKIFCAVFKKG